MKTEILKYASYLLRRAWLIALAALLLGGGAYLYFNSRDPNYRAEARIFVGNAIYASDLTVNDFTLARQLAPTYAEFAKDYDVLSATIDELNLDMTPSALRSGISTRVIIDTAILVINVSSTNPEQAVAIANSVARNLIANTPSNLTPEEEQQLELLREQVNDLQAQIADWDAQSVDILARMNAANLEGNEDDEAQLREEYNRVVDQRSDSQATLAQQSSNYNDLSRRVNRLQIVEEAHLPLGAIRFSPKIAGAGGFLAGAGMAVALLLLYLEYIDDTLRTEGEINRSISLSALASIPRSKGVGKNPSTYILANNETNQRALEGYRKILLNLVFSSPKLKEARMYLIGGPNRQEGRSITLTNLAAVAAESDLKVLLIDADLLNPMLHRVFELDNKHGLIQLLAEIAENPDAFEGNSKRPSDDKLRPYIQQSVVPNLFLLTSGLAGEVSSSRARGFDNMGQAVQAILRAFDFNLILIDVPPALSASDSYLLAVTTKANVVLVARAGSTSRADMIRIRNQFSQLGATIDGVILNEA